MRRILLLAWKELVHIKADPLMLRLIVIPVFAQLFIVGYALTTEVKHTPVAILDESRSPQSREIIASIAQSSLFRFAGMLSSHGEARETLDRGTAKLVLIFPADFSTALKLPGGASVQILIDGQDANSSRVSTGYLSAVLSRWIMQTIREQLEGHGKDFDMLMPVKTLTAILFNPLLLSSWYMVPGLVVILVTMITALLTGFSIVKEKEMGTFEQLLVTPVRPFQIIIGKILPFAAIGLLEIIIFLLMATLWFRIPFRGSVATLLLLSVFFMFSSLGTGILASIIARSSQQVLFLIWFILLFFILLGGLFIPVENMPAWVQKITYFNPVRHFLFIIREIFLKGSGLRELWRSALAMFVIGVGVFTIALTLFTRKI